MGREGGLTRVAGFGLYQAADFIRRLSTREQRLSRLQQGRQREDHEEQAHQQPRAHAGWGR
jgi:hypothetical protein